jgi:hypothetical protein
MYVGLLKEEVERTILENEELLEHVGSLSYDDCILAKTNDEELEAMLDTLLKDEGNQ